MMTVMTTFLALLPILWASSAASGADVMKRIAAPMLGGVGSALILVLIVFPAIFSLWRGHGLPVLLPSPDDRDATIASKNQI